MFYGLEGVPVQALNFRVGTYRSITEPFPSDAETSDSGSTGQENTVWGLGTWLQSLNPW